MKKYMLKRILFSIFSLFAVVMIVMTLVYTLIARDVIFQTDDVWNKKSNNDRIIYEYVQYQKYGYLIYSDYTAFVKDKYQKIYGDDYYTQPDFKADRDTIQKPEEFQSNATVKEFAKKYKADGYSVKYFQPITYKSGKVKPGGTGYLIAVKENNAAVRLVDYVKGFFTVETKNYVDDPALTERYIRFEKDPYSGLFAIVGSGTQHKYLLYFDNRFPFIHQNFIRINLGTSYTTYRGQEITDVINNPTGDIITSNQQYPSMLGTDEYVETAIDFHSLTYNSNEVGDVVREQFPDNYNVYKYKRGGLSIIENSFVIGIIATILSYMLGLPIGIHMARKKDSFADKLGNLYIIFIIAVPSLAYIFMFAALGTTLFHLPYKFANAEVKFFAYILPTISLALPSIGGLMKWMRRYMIDQMNSDYVKFARAEGLSESEIFSVHISKNAMIYIVHGIPGSILGCLTGAIMTERVYSVPGVGNLLTTAINMHDNGVIVACTVFYTSLSLIALILGDVLLTKYDPRISLSEDKGGGR
ncbi:MAG: ABC transporter permease [Lachnospiraceae bacterium]|nr:ABC transporter permease [Lachnospiraceae bacterium]